MKFVHKDVQKDGSGTVTLIPEESEDMWHAYNLIAEGDSLKSTTIRKVTTESATGSTASNRVRTTLTIKVEDVDFDTQACMLRVKGRNIQENQYIKMGAYHTIDLELNRKFTLFKENWDTIALERIDLACDPAQHADLAAIIMQEGIAHVCLVTASMTLVRAKIDVNIPRKRKGMCAQHTKGLEKFYETVYQAVLRHVNFDIVKCVLIASPGFVKDQFYEYMFQQAAKTDNKVLLEHKSAFVLVHASSGFKHSLNDLNVTNKIHEIRTAYQDKIHAYCLSKEEQKKSSVYVCRFVNSQGKLNSVIPDVKEVLADPAIANKLADTKASTEIKCIEQFYTMLMTDPNKAYYGLKHVQKAIEAQAVDTLLISDKLFRCNDVAQRKMYVGLVDSVRESGGDVKMFSSLHPSGEQLDQLTGIAAILRFPMEIEDDDSDTEQ